jgi:hypothetical protein
LEFWKNRGGSSFSISYGATPHLHLPLENSGHNSFLVLQFSLKTKVKDCFEKSLD